MITVLALGVVVSCAYEFGSDMPSATFCARFAHAYRSISSANSVGDCHPGVFDEREPAERRSLTDSRKPETAFTVVAGCREAILPFFG